MKFYQNVTFFGEIPAWSLGEGQPAQPDAGFDFQVPISLATRFRTVLHAQEELGAQIWTAFSSHFNFSLFGLFSAEGSRKVPRNLLKGRYDHQHPKMEGVWYL